MTSEIDDSYEGNGLSIEKNSSQVIVDLKETEIIKPDNEKVDSPLNLSKDESKATTDQGPEAKMVEEAVVEPTATATTTTTTTAAPESEPAAVIIEQETIVKLTETVRDVDSRSDASSPSVDQHREERSRSGSAEEKSNQSEPDKTANSIDDDNSRPVGEDDEVEISAPQNIADELLEVANV